MPDNHGPISTRERRILIAVWLVMSVVVVGFFVDEAVYQYNRYLHEKQMQGKGISLSNGDWRTSPGGLLLLIPLITFSLLRPKRFWIAGGLTFLLAILFITGCYMRLMNARDFGLLDPIAYVFDFGDYLLGIFLIVMVAWQSSIFIRIARAPREKLP